MARYIQDAGINQPLDVVSDAMEEYLRRNRYIRTEWKDELVYMSTNGETKGNRYLIWTYMSGILHIEAWLKGSFGNEAGLTGVGSKKRAYKESIDNLIEALRHPVKDEYTRSETIYQSTKPAQSYTQPAPSAQPYTTMQPSQSAQPYIPSTKPVQPYKPAQPSQSAQPYKPPAQKTAPPYAAQPKEKTQQSTFEPYVPDYRQEKSQKAMRGLTFGVVAIITSFVMSIIGLIFAIIGLGLCNDGMNSDMADKAKLGKTLCIVALVWCGLRIFYYVFAFMIWAFAIY